MIRSYCYKSTFLFLASNYSHTIMSREGLPTGQMQEETQELLDEYNELYNWEYNDMVDFIKSYGEDDFINNYETYQRLVDDYGQGVVDEFMEDYDIENFEDMYQGQYESGAEFAEQICQDCGYISNNIPHWIVIDWERTWEANLRHDYIELGEGHIFSANY